MKQYPIELNSYITTPQRRLFLDELSRGEWAGIFEPLVFFKLLDKTIKEFDSYVSKKEFISVVNQFENLPLKGEERYFFLLALKEELDQKYNERTLGFGFMCMDVVNEHLNSITKQLYPDYTAPIYKIDKAPTSDNKNENIQTLVEPNSVANKSQIEPAANPPTLTFDFIFQDKDWRKYIEVFEKTTPPLLDSNWNFIGKKRGHTGVIASWLRELQLKGIIGQEVGRIELARTLENELHGYKLGESARTISNYSKMYLNHFQQQLVELLNS